MKTLGKWTAVTGLIVVLVAHAQTVGAATLYWGGGSTDIADGTPLSTSNVVLSGTWDDTIRNWATDSNGTTYVAWSNGVDSRAYLPAFLGNNVTLGATITQKIDVVCGSIIANLSRLTGNSYNSLYLITATNSRSITLVGTNPVVDCYLPVNGDYTRYLQFGSNIRLIATNGFVKGTGWGYVSVAGDAAAVTGTVTVLAPSGAGNGVRIESTGNLRNVREFDCWGGSLRVVAPAGAANQMNDAAVVRLRGGCALMYQASRGASVSSESVSQLALGSAGLLNLALGRNLWVKGEE